MNLRNLAITSMILLGMLALYAFVSQGGAMSGAAAPGGAGRPEAVTYSQLLQQVQTGQVKEATIRGEDVTGDGWPVDGALMVGDVDREHLARVQLEKFIEG